MGVWFFCNSLAGSGFAPFVIYSCNIPKLNDFLIFSSEVVAVVCFLHLLHLVSVSL